MDTPLIEFRGVTKRFEGKTVLDKLDLTIYENEITTIIGKSGSGKSVLIKHIIGLLTPDEGRILFRGKPVNEMKKEEWEGYRSKISYMFQNNALFDSMTVFENIALPLRQTTNLRKKEVNSKVMSRLEQMDLAEAEGKYPSELSGGMQKRVALARALVTDPAIVLFDEPTTSQDPIRRNVILSMIAHYRKQFGFTAVLISHDIPDVFFISDHILLLWEGKIAFHGNYEELARLDHPMIHEFFRSIDGLKDELTGLLSKGVFKARYSLVLGGDRGQTTSAAVLFSLHFDRLAEMVGPQSSIEVIKTFGEYVRSYFDPLGGFSTRHSRGEVLTLLPHMGVGEAGQLVNAFAQGLQERGLPNIKSLTGCNISAGTTCGITVTAGITDCCTTDSLEEIMGKAATSQKIIVTCLCAREGSAK